MIDGSEKEIYQDELFLGLTRPTTFWGVPHGAFVFEVVAIACIFLAVGDPFILLLVVPMHLLLYALSATDPKFFEVIWVWAKTSGKCQTRKHWGMVSFSPNRSKKWKD